MRIEIAGSIAVGKTTLTRFLARKGWTVVSENLSEVPYLTKQFPEKSRKGFYLQMAFLLSKAAGVETQPETGGHVVYDYALINEYAYTRLNLIKDREAFAVAMDAIDYLREGLPKPDLVVYLACPAQVQYDRIQERMKKEGSIRDFEKAVTLEYLEKLNKQIEYAVKEYERAGGKVLRIETDKVNLTDEKTLEVILIKILGASQPSQPSLKPQP